MIQSPMDPEQDQDKFKRIGLVAIVISNSLALVFIFHNIYRYVIGLQMRQPLIWMFYILILVCTILRIIQFSLLIYNLELDFFTNSTALVIHQLVVSAAIYVELTLMLTMHKLCIALKLILGEISQYEVKRAERHGIRFVLSYALVCLAFDLLIWVKGQKE